VPQGCTINMYHQRHSGMADTRYLKQRHQTWYFVAAIPRALRGKFRGEGPNRGGGRPLSKIVVSLKTQSLGEAQDRRWPLVKHWRETFQRAQTGEPLSLVEIDAQAQEIFTSTLERMEVDAKRHRLSANEERESLNQGLYSLLEDMAVVSLDPSEPGTPIDDLIRFDAIAHELKAVERRTGVQLEPDSKTYQLMGQAAVRALIAAAEGRLRALEGKPSDPPATFLGAHGIDPRTLRPIVASPRKVVRIRTTAGMRFSEAAARYIEARRKAGKMTAHTQRQRETVFRLFTSFTNDATLAAIDKLTATDFLEQIGKLNANWHHIEGARELPLNKLVEKCADRSGKLTNRTINSYIHALSGVFKLAEKEGHFEGRNPFAGRTLEETNSSWRSYKTDELNQLFSTPLLRNMSAEQRIRPAKYTFENAMAWIPLLGLFSGMRSNEICQMRASDVQRNGRIWLFNVSDDNTGQSLKTEAATRIVPIHSELIRCGFLDYVEALPRDGQLFPALKPGGPDGKYNHYFAKRFTEYRRKSGVTAPRTSFHSFRENVAQALKDKRATVAEIAELIGHEQGFTFSVYAPMQLPVKTLKELIERVRYQGLRLNHMYLR
jgi:integrase